MNKIIILILIFGIGFFMGKQTSNPDIIRTLELDNEVTNIMNYTNYIHNLKYITNDTTEENCNIKYEEFKPIRITSGFRCETLNKKVSGVSHSIHKTGLACDFIFINIIENQMKEIAIYVRDNIKLFDQLIISPDRNFIHFNLRNDTRSMLLLSLCGQLSLGKSKYKKLEV